MSSKCSAPVAKELFARPSPAGTPGWAPRLEVGFRPPTVTQAETLARFAGASEQVLASRPAPLCGVTL